MKFTSSHGKFVTHKYQAFKNKTTREKKKDIDDSNHSHFCSVLSKRFLFMFFFLSFFVLIFSIFLCIPSSVYSITVLCWCSFLYSIFFSCFLFLIYIYRKNWSLRQYDFTKQKQKRRKEKWALKELKKSSVSFLNEEI